MGSLRNKMISEMLNYERSMNRIVLDRTIEQAKLFNETRNPPSSRDIKFEALIGDLVNKVKQKIQETTSMIAETQYEEVDTKQFISAMKKPTGDEPRNGAIQTGAEYDDISEEDASTESFYSDDFEDGDSPNSEEAQINQVGKGFSRRMTGMGKAKRILKRGKKDPLNILKRRKGGGANSEGEGESPLPTGEGPQEQQQIMSDEEKIKKVENGVLSIVSEYNGLVSKILEATQPQGRFASRATTSQTNVQFLGNILRDLAQPLKQLEFELSSSRFPEITKYFNLINNMVKIVESSPPFQKINSDAYKNAPIDFQGANDAMVLDDPSYKKQLESFAKRLYNSYKKLLKMYPAYRFNMQALERTNPTVFQAGLDQILNKTDQVGNTLEEVKRTIEEIGTRELTKKNKANILRELKYRTEEAETALLDNIVEGHRQAAAEAARKAPTRPAPPSLAAARMFADTGAPAPQYASPKSQPKMGRPDVDTRNFNRGPRKTPLSYMEQLQQDIRDDEESDAVMAQLELDNRAEEFGIEDVPPDVRQVLDLQREYLANQEQLSEEDSVDDDLTGDVLARLIANVQSRPRMKQPTRQLDIGAIMLDTSRKSKKVENKEGAPRRASQRTQAPNLSIPRNLVESDRLPRITVAPAARAFMAANKPSLPLLTADRFSTMSFLELKAEARAKGISLAYGQSGGVKSKAELTRDLRASEGYTGKGRKGKKSKKDKEEKEGGGVDTTDGDQVRAVEIAMNKRFQKLSNPIHSTTVGKLYPFDKKDPASKYTYPMLLKHQRGKSAPTKNALGADYSLLQGQVGGPTVYPKQPKKPRTRKIVTKEEATQNIIEGKGRRKNKKALHKLNFNDEKNEMFD